MDMKNFKDLDETMKTDDTNSFKISEHGDPNNPVEFAGITKNLIKNMDKNI